jgi:hypothetical protein
MFVDTFTTYRPLLIRIKEEYDHALNYCEKAVNELAALKTRLCILEERWKKDVHEMQANHIHERETLKYIL